MPNAMQVHFQILPTSGVQHFHGFCTLASPCAFCHYCNPVLLHLSSLNLLSFLWFPRTHRADVNPERDQQDSVTRDEESSCCSSSSPDLSFEGEFERIKRSLLFLRRSSSLSCCSSLQVVTSVGEQLSTKRIR